MEFCAKRKTPRLIGGVSKHGVLPLCGNYFRSFACGKTPHWQAADPAQSAEREDPFSICPEGAYGWGTGSSPYVFAGLAAACP
jgi:hypothetical protein